jgi:two-component system response regulator PilR (NtrC family)
VRKVGATQEEPVDVRLISATHQNLSRLVEAGKFRQDLFYRLNVIELKMPPLRDCREDVPRMAASILERIAQAGGGAPARLSEAALAELCSYDFPGNIRELENVLERATALSGDAEIGPDALMLRPAGAGPGEVRAAEGALDEALPEYLDRVEREAILEALARTRFNRTAAAKLLGITFRTLRYRMQRLGIKDENRG